jgi:hypothetical protein
MINADYIHFSLPELYAIKQQCLDCQKDNFAAHASYSIAGHQITRANLAVVSQILTSVAYAIRYNGGQISRSTVSDMSNGTNDGIRNRYGY